MIGTDESQQTDLRLVDPPPTFAAFVRQPDSNQSLRSLVAQYERGEIVAPPHQRDPEAWDNKKRKAWIDRIFDVQQAKAQPPLGVVCVYMLSTGRDTAQYLNDGLQRIAASYRALSHPELYGKAKEDVERALSMTFIHVQNRVYGGHKEAAEDFVRVNAGLSLEPSEKHRNILVYARGWDLTWEPIIDRWHTDLQGALASYCRPKLGRKAILDSERQDLQIFSVSLIGRPTEFGKGDELEKAVESCFDRFKDYDVRRQMKKIYEFSAEIEDAWRAHCPEHAFMMQTAFAKWLIGVRLLNDHSPVWWKAFYEKLFRVTNGEACFHYKRHSGEYESNKTEFLTKRLTVFPRICDKLGIELPDVMNRMRRKSLKQGFQNDHKQAFADFGEGHTEPMPARLNAAKNARASL